MGELQLVHLIVVLGIIITSIIPWGYPLSRLCRRAGKAPAIGWIAGSIGMLFFGPIVCLWWLALSKWDPPPTNE